MVLTDSQTTAEFPSRTQRIAQLIEQEKLSILDAWLKDIRSEFSAGLTISDAELSDHLLEVLEQVQFQVAASAGETDYSDISQYAKMDSQHGSEDMDHLDSGSVHGRQRASIHSYDAERVYWEYVWLRRIIYDVLKSHDLLDVESIHQIACAIENCSRNSIASFSNSVQAVQRKILGSLVHDIRSPLNVISTTVGMLSLGAGTDKLPAHTKVLQRAVNRMSAMLEDMLQTISIEGGKGFDLCFSKQMLLEGLDVTITDLSALYGDRFVAELPESDVEVTYDGAAVTRTLENLVSNAFKYGGADTEVVLKIGVNSDCVEISVHNFGNPIPLEDWDRIFEFLRKRDSHTPEDKRSWGIGLALAKATCKGHKGDIRVESSDEKGTSFTMRLPRHVLKEGTTTTVII